MRVVFLMFVFVTFASSASVQTPATQKSGGLKVKHNSTSDALAIVNAFESQAIPRTEWTHASYLTVGIYYSLRFPFEAALNAMRWGVILVNEANSVANTNTAGYHETMTVFWMTIAA